MSGDGHGGGAGGHGSVHDDHDEHEEHEEHVNHEAWVIPYADLLTLLMAMFIALFAISNVDLVKFKKLAEGFSQALNGGSAPSATVVDLGGSGKDIFSTPLNSLAQAAQQGAEDAATVAADPSSKAAATVTIRNLPGAVAEVEQAATTELQQVQDSINLQAAQTGFSANLQTKIDDRGLVITVVTDQVVFGSGSADIGQSGSGLLGVVAGALSSIDNRILVEGHTDNVPIATSSYPSNWELSSARAGAVVRYFESAAAIPPGRLEAAGFADTQPIDTNETDAGRARNRRVEVIVESDAQERKNRILEEAIQASERLQRPDDESATSASTTH